MSRDQLVSREKTSGAVDAKIARLRQWLEENVPASSSAGDGSAVPDSILAELEAAFADCETTRLEWIQAFDAVPDPMFFHDRDYRILHANRAYADCAGRELAELVGRVYWEVFPRRDGPLSGCASAQEPGGLSDELFTTAKGAIYRSRGFVVSSQDDEYRFSVHVLENVTAAEQARETLEARDRRQAVLVALGGHALERSDSDELMQQAVKAVADALAVEDCRVLERLPSGEALRLRAAAGDVSVPATMSVDHDVLAARVLEGQEPVNVEDLRADSRFQATSLLVEDEVVSGIGVLIPAVEAPFGVLEVLARTTRVFSDDEVNFLQSIAHLLATAIRRTRYEQQLTNNNQLLETMFEAIDIKVAYLDAKFNFIRVNEQYARGDEKTADFFPGKNHFDLYPDAENEAIFRQVVETGEPYTATAKPFEYPDHPQWGITYWDWRLQPIKDDEGKVEGLVFTLNDVTRHKQAELALQATRESLEQAQRIAQLGNWDWDIVQGSLWWSDEIYRIFGLETQEFEATYEAFLERIHPEDRQAVMNAVDRALQNDEPYSIDHRILRPDGTERVVHEQAQLFRNEKGEPVRMVGTVQDVTELRHSEMVLQRTNRALRTLSACNEALVRTEDEQQLLDEICRIIVELGDYRLAWVGYAQSDENKSVQPVARAGYDAGYVDRVAASWAEASPRGQGPVGQAIRQAKAIAVQDVASDENFGPWREAAREHDYASLVALPIMTDDAVLGTLTLYSSTPDAFDKEEFELLQELANDLGYGIGALRTKADREQAVNRLREMLYATIEAMALTIEKRDPYTAGHQYRVAMLAAAIGTELELEPERIEGLRLAGQIHDIGKIYIPAEILTRPGRLSAMEFELIKAHTTVGYEIVQDIPFPWPVARMIREHHERLDGTGYPDALRDEQILFESKILAVADVVEAIASHRPYRAALGLDAALEEIQALSGSKYEPDVVDACIRLFRDKGFELPAGDRQSL
ncbi:GAF domain-containing protein [Thiohalophilus thiocyanatoxydans]|uniref:PAS domain S-box-containing protein/putative nucleotidyltransferase with HDIG domain n=1 Tax=Thiohalophilus thiocyanatoxydans TaxID=381308 RepID=A0A4R8IJM9_9GAMM|nr:HD domain-containing phosphohydrolase [Thiohalophilus thiocyanatoxydans]TDY00558.1 PAS domain S-box-containing protein/putative nucleotidyltransferase with HDIG domain [Thiohalophilus thiocyanatoxydans]